MGSGSEPLDARREAAGHRLTAALNGLEAAFPDRGPPPITACDCPVCLTPDNRRELETSARDRITLSALSDYLQSVVGDDPPDAEVDYFIPVIFEALAARLEPHPFGDHHAFQRLGRSDRSSGWNDPQRMAVNEAFCALAEAAMLNVWLEKTRFDAAPSRFHRIDFLQLAAVADDASADVDAVLAEIDRAPAPQLASALIQALRLADYGDGQRWRLDPRSDEQTPLSETLYAWIGRPELRRRLETAFFASDCASESEAAALSEAHQLLVWQFGPTD